MRIHIEQESLLLGKRYVCAYSVTEKQLMEKNQKYKRERQYCKVISPTNKNNWEKNKNLEE